LTNPNLLNIEYGFLDLHRSVASQRIKKYRMEKEWAGNHNRACSKMNKIVGLSIRLGAKTVQTSEELVENVG
jgi:hypothetical protein